MIMLGVGGPVLMYDYVWYVISSQCVRVVHEWGGGRTVRAERCVGA